MPNQELRELFSTRGIGQDIEYNKKGEPSSYFILWPSREKALYLFAKDAKPECRIDPFISEDSLGYETIVIEFETNKDLYNELKSYENKSLKAIVKKHFKKTRRFQN